MDVYPIRWMSWLAAVTCVGFGMAAIVLLFVGDPSVYQRVILLGGAAVIPFVARGVLRELRHPKPALRLDRGGVEGAFGRIPWHNVERISVGVRWEWPGFFRPKLVLHLRHKMRPAPRTRQTWASEWLYSGGIVRGDEVLFQLWGGKGRVKNEIGRFYRGPIE